MKPHPSTPVRLAPLAGPSASLAAPAPPGPNPWNGYTGPTGPNNYGTTALDKVTAMALTAPPP